MTKRTLLLGWAALIASMAFADAHAQSSVTQEKTFNVFFAADGIALTEEGRDIVLAAAKTFARAPDAHVFLVGDGPALDQRSAVVKGELVKDGVPAAAIRVRDGEAHEAMPPALEEWQERRVLIAVGPMPPVAKTDRAQTPKT